MLELKLEHPEGKKAYCCNAREIVEAAELRNLTRAQIAHIADVDPKTVYVWKKEGNGDPKSLKRLVDYLNTHSQEVLVPPDEHIVALTRWINEGKRLGINCTNCPLSGNSDGSK